MGKITSVIDHGFNGTIIESECLISNGLPSIVIVGYANKAVDEAKERIRGAFTNSGLAFPKKRIVINLAPGDLPKNSTSLDFAIAVSIMQQSKLIKEVDESHIISGELGLDGSIRPVRGIVGKLLTAKRNGVSKAFIPHANIDQAAIIDGIEIIPVKNLGQFYLHISGNQEIPPLGVRKDILAPTVSSTDFSEVHGQQAAKRALEIAAAGGHNVLLSGPPGTGKSMLAKALPSILPALTRDQVLETTHLHSLCSRNYQSVIDRAPFRAPHHTASDASIVGGGTNPRPGEISLAHNGVLLFDEFPEFRRSSLEALRQPLEDKKIVVSRANDTLEFPAKFIFVATSNPCPCGYLGTHRECSCSPAAISRYRQKMSGPILDRIDIFCDVENVDHSKILDLSSVNERSSDISKRVLKARKKQRQNLGSGKLNSDIPSKSTAQLDINADAKEFAIQAANKLELSPRALVRTLRVARTIADLEDSQLIETKHVAEALQYRPKNMNI